MTDTALHLVERVLPEVPMRQWVCSLPWDLRCLLGYDRALCAEALSAFVEELMRSYRSRSKRPSTVSEGEGGSRWVAVPLLVAAGSELGQLFGLVPGVFDPLDFFAVAAAGALRWPAPRPPRRAAPARSRSSRSSRPPPADPARAACGSGKTTPS